MAFTRRALFPAAAATFAAVPAAAAVRREGCFVPAEFRHLKWHIIRSILLEGKPGPLERAEWVNDPRNGPKEGGHWMRWGRCGDLPSLCRATYIRPDYDQDSPYFDVDPRWFYKNA